MARNTGPAPNAPRWPEQREQQSAPRQEPVGRPAPRPPQPHNAPQHGQHAQPAGYATGYDAPDAYDHYAAGHGQPAVQQPYPAHQGYADPYAPPQAHAHAGHAGYAQPHASQYAPQFEPYQPPQQHAPAEPGWPPHPHQQQAEQWQHAEPPTQRTGQPTQAAPRSAQPAEGQGYDPGYPQEPRFASDPYTAPPAPQLRGATYDQGPGYGQPQQTQSGWSTPAAADPYAQSYAPEPAAWSTQQGYDQHGYAPQAGYDQQGYDQQGYDPQAIDPATGYAQSNAYGYDAAAYGEPAADAGGYARDPGFGPADGGYAPPARQAEQGYGEEDYDPEEVAYEDDVPRGRGRLVKLAAAAAVALAVVGGGVYGYMELMGPSNGGKPPVVRKAEAPAKVKPDDPGGKKFAHTDSKILGRLSDPGSRPETASAPAADDGDPNGTRKVSTMVIGRDGSIVPAPAAQRPPPTTLPAAVSPVPGMTIVDGFGGRQPQISGQPPASAPAMVNGTAPAAAAPAAPPPAAPPATAKAAAPAPPAAAPPTAKPPAKPVVIARTEPAAATPAEAPVVEKPAAAPKPPATRKTAALKPPAETGTAAPSGAGYVAVLASIPRSGSSRMDALKQFADLQQRYAAQLGGKTPDVQEANLGDKGTYHRLIVGPPGSRQQASRLCSELKTAGYGSCWVKSY